MLAPSGGLLQAGLGLKLNHIKRATRSYVRDRTNQATNSVTSYVVAAGLFAAAGIFLIAACLVGITALFRWIEINYGLFHAFGAIGGLLVVIAAILAGVAVAKLKRPAPRIPVADQPAARGDPRQPDRSVTGGDGAGCRRLRSVGDLVSSSQAASRSAARTEQIPAAGRTCAVGSVARHRRDKATAGDAPHGRVMRARPGHG